MAERKGITSVRFWEACYMDEKEKNMNLETRIVILEGDVRVNKSEKNELAKMNNELKRELFEAKKEIERLKQEHEEDVAALRNLARVLQQNQQKLDRTEDLIEGLKTKGVQERL